MNNWLKILSLNIEFTDTTSFRRVLLINSISILTATVFIIFIFINTFIVQNYIVAGLDLIASIVAISTLVYLKKTQNILLSSKIATANLMLFFLSFAYVNGNTHFSLIWTIFLPIFAIFVNGKKVGLYFSLFFYTFLFSMAFLNIGIWDDGKWGTIEFIRLCVASSVLTFTTQPAHPPTAHAMYSSNDTWQG